MTRQEQRRARRQNRIRRLERYKNGKTYHGIIKGICRKYKRIITTPLIYCTTDMGEPYCVDFHEAARRLMFANPDPRQPVLFIIDKSEADGWQKENKTQMWAEWNPGGGET